MTLICGVDEAGRGPVIGPLVMCGVLIEDKDETKLKTLKVKDSKLLTAKQREFLYNKIIKIAKKYKIIIVDVNEVDNAVNGLDNLNLNKLEANKTADIINHLNPDKAIIDTPSNNIKKYENYLSKLIINATKLILEHKADYKYPVVSAASILAKVTRDNEIKKIKNKINHDFGSGYMSDPKTVKFLDAYFEKHKNIFRKSWIPYKERLNNKFQSKLEDFSKFVKN